MKRCFCINNHNDLTETHLTRTPEPVNYFTRMTRIFLIDGDDGNIVENTFPRQPIVTDFRHDYPDQGQKYPFRGLGKVAILHGRASHQDGAVNGISAVRYGRYMKNRIDIGQRIIARMITKGSLHAAFIRVDIAFQDNLCLCRNLNIHGYSWD